MNLLNLAAIADDFDVPKGTFDNNSVEAILTIVFGVVGAVAIIVILLASLKYIISRGDPGEVAKAKNAILYGVIGLIIVASAFTIVTFVVGRV